MPALCCDTGLILSAALGTVPTARMLGTTGPARPVRAVSNTLAALQDADTVLEPSFDILPSVTRRTLCIDFILAPSQNRGPDKHTFRAAMHSAHAAHLH